MLCKVKQKNRFKAVTASDIVLLQDSLEVYPHEEKRTLNILSLWTIVFIQKYGGQCQNSRVTPTWCFNVEFSHVTLYRESSSGRRARFSTDISL